MVNKLFVAWTTRNEMLPNKATGQDSLKFHFHTLTALLLAIMMSHQAFALVLPWIHLAIIISDKVWRWFTLFASIILVSDEYHLYPL